MFLVCKSPMSRRSVLLFDVYPIPVKCSYSFERVLLPAVGPPLLVSGCFSLSFRPFGVSSTLDYF